ncbi:hypothetical protein AB0E81_18535 [Streptomyces sp. NPDC033538]|uniref:hypothetical protein n=1 Tax=Streptomyces sp. NPDC033538 TaxID=3155367 RepID=UPI0033E76FD5
MSESTTQTATQLASQYSAQVTDDLERNVKEQERISAEITSAQQQLAALQHDHALLVNMQQALGIASPPAQPATAPESATTDAAMVPAPREGTTTEPAAGKRTRSRKTATSSKRTAAAKPGAKAAAKAGAKPAAEPAAKPSAKTVKTVKATKKPAAKKESAQATSAADASPAKQAADRPTLVELVRTHLVEQSEPRSAAEVTTALGQAHSGRTIKTTVVRTTLEGLVAKNQAQRTKQGTSVYYTATDAPEAKQDAGTRTSSAQSDS